MPTELRSGKMAGHAEQGEGNPAAFQTIIEKLNGLSTQQENMQKMLETKIDELRDELKADIESKLQGFKTKISQDISKLSEQCSSLRKDVDQLSERLATLSNTTENNSDTRPVNSPANSEPVNNIDQTVIIANLKEQPDDPLTLNDYISDLLKAMGDGVADVEVMQVKRLNGRDGKPGLVKVAFDSLDSKKKVLQAKFKLQDSTDYKKVWLRSSKTHIERIQEQNVKKLLELIPGGDQLKLTSNGRLLSKNSDDQSRQVSSRGRGYIRGRGGSGPEVRGGRGGSDAHGGRGSSDARGGRGSSDVRGGRGSFDVRGRGSPGVSDQSRTDSLGCGSPEVRGRGNGIYRGSPRGAGHRVPPISL